MKSVLLGEDRGNFERVFSPEMISRLKETADCDGEYYSRDYVLTHREFFCDTEYIFSTWGMSQYSEEEIKTVFPRLKCVFYAAGTVQYFARPFLRCGVRVFSASAANGIPVAEYTTAQILLANKGFFASCKPRSLAEVSEKLHTLWNYPGNYGADVGIIGAGMIGKLVIQMLKSHHLNVLVFDPFLPDETAEELGVRKTDLKELFSCCQVVSNHLANNPQTVGMLNGELFSLMRPYATFINTGRGAQVVEKDLIETLKKRPDLIALLDVTEPEPPVAESEIYRLDNCIFTPHIAGSSGDEVKRMADFMYKEYLRCKEGNSTKYEVTLKMLETMA